MDSFNRLQEMAIPFYTPFIIAILKHSCNHEMQSPHAIAVQMHSCFLCVFFGQLNPEELQRRNNFLLRRRQQEEDDQRKEVEASGGQPWHFECLCLYFHWSAGGLN